MKLNIKNSYKFNNALFQSISWGHWFTLFNIFIVIILGSQYLSIADWPTTFMGRFYAIISSIGQFSFLCFSVYLITLFPLSFIIRAPRFFRLVGALVATIGVMLILVDIAVFSRCRMHLNFTIWEILTTANDSTLLREWQRLFIFVPFIFLFEILLSLWIWKNLRRFTKKKIYVRPVVILLVLCFLSSHLCHIWADAYFYRPITMQRSSLPLSYPMTARHFLTKHGFVSIDNHKGRLENSSPFAMTIEYPLGAIDYKQPAQPTNLVLITIDGMVKTSLDEMPYLRKFADNHIYFSHHFSASNESGLSLFSLFYGLDANYYNSIMASSTPSPLLETIAKQQYNIGFFSSDAFNAPVFQHALLADFSIPTISKEKTNQETTNNWLTWFSHVTAEKNDAPWFSLINYQVTNKKNAQMNTETLPVLIYKNRVQEIDQQIKNIIGQLEKHDALKNTVIIITANKSFTLHNNTVHLATADSNFDRRVLEVPLIIAWPQKASEKITTMTTHVDIMRTLMEDALHVTTAPEKYSQGLNLFTLPDVRNWVIAANQTDMAALYQHKTVVISNNGHYIIYDNSNVKLSNEKLGLAIFFELLTNNRRFMVTN